jgi:thioredoxin-like negative regulator of GroEL
MRGTRLGGISVSILLAFAAAASPVAAAGDALAGIPWGEKIGAALDQAADSGKLVMVDIWAVWCVPCKEMEHTTYLDGRVIDLAERFVPLKVDADVKTSFIERYRVDAFPTLLFLDGNGRELTRWRGAITADPLAELLDRISSGYEGYLDALARSDDPDAAAAVADYLVAVGNAEAAVDHLRDSLKDMKKADPVVREAMELRLCEAQVASGLLKSACKSLSRLVDEAGNDEIRGKALVGLVQVERERGRDDEAAAALERLRAEHPELAATAGF